MQGDFATLNTGYCDVIVTHHEAKRPRMEKTWSTVSLRVAYIINHRSEIQVGPHFLFFGDDESGSSLLR